MIVLNYQFYFGVRNSLAMAYSFSEDNYSLVHLLKKNGNIDKLAFSIVRDKTDKYIYFGGIPEESIINLYESNLKVLGRTNYWDCLLFEVILINDTINIYQMNDDDNSSYTYFEPKSFLNKLYSTYLKEVLDSSLCKFMSIKTLNQYYDF